MWWLERLLELGFHRWCLGHSYQCWLRLEYFLWRFSSKELKCTYILYRIVAFPGHLTTRMTSTFPSPQMYVYCNYGSIKWSIHAEDFFIYPPPLPSHLHIPLPRIDISAWWQQWGSTSDSFFRIIKTGQMHATRFSTLCTCTANGLPPSMQKWLQQVLLGTCACKSTLHIVHYIEHGPLLELTLTCTCSCRSALILVNMHMYTCTNACNKLSIY